MAERISMRSNPAGSATEGMLTIGLLVGLGLVAYGKNWFGLKDLLEDRGPTGGRGSPTNTEADCARRILLKRSDLRQISSWSGGTITSDTAIVREWLRITTENVDKSGICAAARSLGA